MNSPSDPSTRRAGAAWRIAVPIALLALITAVLFWPDESAAPEQADAVSAQESSQDDGSRPDPNRRVSAGGSTERREAATGPREAAADGETRQGVQGRVVDPAGMPIVGATVELAEGAAANLLASTLLAQSGTTVPPIARAVTDDAGRFVLGLTEAPSPAGAGGRPDAGYDLSVRHELHPARRLGGVHLFAERWIDVGDIELPRGVTLAGQVLVQGREDFPVPDAEITLQPAGTRKALGPGDLGASVSLRSDASGRFELRPVAPSSVWRVSALAPGFARVTLPAVVVGKEPLTQVRLLLPEGHEIFGTVRDSAAALLQDAVVEARAIGSSMAHTERTRTDAQGRYRLRGLAAGAYRVVVQGRDHLTARRQPIVAGTGESVDFALSAQHLLHVRVQAGGGTSALPPSAYDVVLRRARGDERSLGNVPGARLERVTQRDLLADGRYRYGGVEPGRYVFEVRAEGFTRSFSPVFEIAAPAGSAAGEPLGESTVDVSLRRGGWLQGTVTDADGRPLAQATVTAAPDELEDSPYARAFAELLVFRASVATTTTDRDGRFQLPGLAESTYRVSVRHPDYARTVRRGHFVVDGERHEVGKIPLGRGVRVHGDVRIGERPASQVRISLRSVSLPGGRDHDSILVEAVSLADGTFELDERLPPGRYIAEAARTIADNVLIQALDRQSSRRELSLTAGQDATEVRLLLPEH